MVRVVECREKGIAKWGQALDGNNPGNRTRKETREGNKRRGRQLCTVFLTSNYEKLKCRGAVGVVLTEVANRVCWWPCAGALRRTWFPAMTPARSLGTAEALSQCHLRREDAGSQWKDKRQWAETEI